MDTKPIIAQIEADAREAVSDVLREVEDQVLNIHVQSDLRLSQLKEETLQKAREAIMAGERDTIRIKNLLQATIGTSLEANIDYAEIYDAATLADVQEIDGRVLIALAVRFGTTRLIDNLIVEVQ